MKKLLYQGLVSLASVVLLWFCLLQIDWVKLFNVRQLSEATERKLGEIMWKYSEYRNKEVVDKAAQAQVQRIFNKLCNANKLNNDWIKIHVVDNKEVNAYALPGGHIVINSGLIQFCNDSNQLSGVICHELAHIELNHITKRIIKEIGLSTVLAMTSGEAGGEIIKNSIKMFSSTAYDRRLEAEADMMAVDYLKEADINSCALADFFVKLSETEGSEMEQYLTYINTHPDLKDRINSIRTRCDANE